MANPLWIVIVAILAIALLLFLVLRMKMNEVIALLVVSVLVGIGVGMSPKEIYGAMEEGMGGALGFLAIVIGMGAMFGEVLKVSGGAERLSLTLFNKFGENKVNWSLGLVGMIVAIPIFFEVAVVVFAPIVHSMTQNTKKSIVYFCVPLVVGIAVTYSMIPPAAGALAGASILHVDLGWFIVLGIIVGIPAMAVGGPIFGSFISKRIYAEAPMMEAAATDEANNQKEMPNFTSVVLIILLPLILMVSRTIVEHTLAEGNLFREIITYIGHPFGALTITALAIIYFFGTKKGYTRDDIQKITSKALEPAGLIILITGAGAVFGKVLVESGIGDIIANVFAGSNLPLILFAFVTAALVRAAQGSGTVAIITASTLIAPIVENNPMSAPALALVAVTIGCGAIMTSHVNDSAFWMFKRFFGLTELQTLKSWTVATAITSVSGFVMCLIVSLFI